MDIINLFRNLESYLSIKNRMIYSIPVEEQKRYLDSLPKPKNEIERSYNQYICQMKLKGKRTSIILNFFSGIVFWSFFIVYKRKKIPQFTKQTDAVFLPDGKSMDIIPNSIKKEFLNIECEKKGVYCLNAEDVEFIKKIKDKYRYKGLFLFKILIKIARYRSVIEYYKPRALIVCNEYSFTSSVMKLFCNNNNIELINVMHGEKRFSIRDSFFEFNRCYVWNEFYIELFAKLRTGRNQFIVEIPDSMRLAKCEGIAKNIDYTYYLTDENVQLLKKILFYLERLSEFGFAVAIRSHPRYTNILKMKVKIPPSIQVENTEVITICESLGRTRNAISFGSTVLNQAYFNGIKVVVDDLTRPDEFAMLKEQEYIILQSEHELFSNIIKDLLNNGRYS